MLYPDLVPISIEDFGGYCPALPAANLPPGGSPLCQDVSFPMAGLATRGGLGVIYSNPIPNNAAINGLKTYITPQLVQRLMAWDSLGNLYKDTQVPGPPAIGLVASRPQGTGSLYCSRTAFGREYQAFFNSSGGIDIPRQFDDTNWDRVSHTGPGAAPVVVDDVNVVAITQLQQFTDNPTAIAPQSNVAGVTTVNLLFNTTPRAFVDGFTSAADNPVTAIQVGDQFVLTGVNPGGYNGTWQVSALTTLADGTIVGIQFQTPTNLGPVSATGTFKHGFTVMLSSGLYQAPPIHSLTFSGVTPVQYNGNWPIRYIPIAANTSTSYALFVFINTQGLAATLASGFLTQFGNILPGLHGVSVAFINRQGYISKPAPPNFWQAGGYLKASLSQIPIGPSNIVARLILFTQTIIPPATQGTFYSITSTMLIADNTTTAGTFNFDEATLAASFQAEYLFGELELGESAFASFYNYRTLFLGERNKQPNFVNLEFDGGWDQTGTGFPLGWTPGASFAGGQQAFSFGDWQDCYSISGDGFPAHVRGLITQSAVTDYLGVPIISPNTTYFIRVRIKKDAALLSGTLTINLQSTIGGILTNGLAVQSTLCNQNFQEFTALLTNPLASIPSDLQLQVFSQGMFLAGPKFYVDSIEIYPANSPYNSSTARFSYAFNPEAFDQVTGQVQVRPGDGESLQAGFPIRSNYYLAKDHYLCYVTDDGVNEPSGWDVNEVSATVGICGPNAVDWTEEWAVFAERSGLYICWGADPVKITDEIQSDASRTGKISWQSINWAAGYTIWVRIDQVNKKILVGVPVNGATSPNIVLMMDYRWLSSAADIAASPLVTYSAFTGKILAHGRGRRWVPWNIQANSMCFAERVDGTQQPFFGNGAGNGKIYWQQEPPINTSDDGQAINSFWNSYFLPSTQEEQELQIGPFRKLLGYLQLRAIGAGNLFRTIITAQRTTFGRTYTLSTKPPADVGLNFNVHGNRFSLSVGTNAVGSWFSMEKLIAYVKKDATIPVRGTDP